MQIFLARNNVQAGPYSLDELNTMLAANEVELEDLMWHEGMENWQRVGTVTHEHRYYNPSMPSVTPSYGAVQAATQASDSSAESTRTSVEQLYGRPERPTSDQPISLAKPSPMGRSTNTDKPLAIADAPLASIGQRLAAFFVDQLLGLACLVPLLSGIGFDMEALSKLSQDPEAANTVLSTLPAHLTLLTAVMLLSLLVVQVVLLIKRGQTLGKLILGIAIVDAKTGLIPSVTNLILLRYILTNIAYSLPMVGMIIFVADVVCLFIDKQRRSLHDRLAKTLVIKIPTDTPNH